MSTSAFKRLQLSANAQPLLDQTLARVDAAGRKRVEALLVDAAGANGNRHLSEAEARTVADAFERVAAGAAGPLTPSGLETALADASRALSALRKDNNVDGMSVHFTFSEKLTTRIIQELNDAVTRANGRRLDVNMMIFQFQSDDIGNAVVEIARAHPNVTFRIIGDSSQAAAGGGNELPNLLKKHLPNIQVKYKKDFPYTWDAQKQMPKWNHGSTQGLLHHKGFSTFIDGAPDRLVAGSFNWSNTAERNNYENLNVFRNQDASSRRAVEQWGQEFAAFFNNQDACLSPNAFQNFKKQKWNDLVVANGGRPVMFRPLEDDTPAAYQPAVDNHSFDLNGWRTTDAQRLEALVGRTVAREVRAAFQKAGRFHSLEELAERVPSVATLPADVKAQLVDQGFFGSGVVSINNASLEELDRAGFSRTDAAAIVAHREQHGDFQSVEDLRSVPGISAAELSRMRARLSAVDVEGFFNSRPFDAAAGGTGYGPDGGRTTVVTTAGGTAATVAANVSVAATDLFHGARAGQTIRVAMYGLSEGSPECQALVAAARRGIPVRVVLDEGSARAGNALKALAAQGLPLEVRVQTAKTMHEKFGVVGDDVFTGSANFSTSSSTKHSENRWGIKNHAQTTEAFAARFEDLWQKSRA